MENILIYVGFILVVFLLMMSIASFFLAGWIYSITVVALAGSVILLIRLLWKKARENKDNTQALKRAETVSKITVAISVILIVIGVLLFSMCFINGPTSYEDKFTTCGWCGGDGLVSGEICTLCYGGGGASRAEARYSTTNITWLGVVIADAGIAIIYSTNNARKKYTSDE